MDLMDIIRLVGAVLGILMLGILIGRESIMRHALSLLDTREETPLEKRVSVTLAKVDRPTAVPVPGLYQKFAVTRIEGEDKEGEQFFVLSPTHDPMARAAIEAYAGECEQAGLDELASDLYEALMRVGGGYSFYQTEEAGG